MLKKGGNAVDAAIATQLALFKSGHRANAIMQPFAAALSAQDMRDIGAYYATQKSGAGIADDTVIAQGPNQGGVGQWVHQRVDSIQMPKPDRLHHLHHELVDPAAVRDALMITTFGGFLVARAAAKRMKVSRCRL